MAFLINGSPIITNDRDLSQVGIATVTEDVNIGRLLYDANGNVGAGNSILVTQSGSLQWVDPSAIGISTGASSTPGSTYYVTENGSDSNDGESLNNAWASISYALSQITVSGDDALYITAGDYTETFPLTVPAGLTIKGAGQRATIIRPTSATETENGFLLNNDTTVEDLSIGAMFKPQGSTNYAFSYESGAAITTRGPYISRVSVINKGSNVTASDPYGYASADNYPVSAPGAAGFLADGSVLDSSTTSPSMLLNEITIFPVGNVGIEMVNGTRMEVLNSFVYFASEGIKGRSDLSTGLSGSGRTRLSLENPSATPAPAEPIAYYDTDGTTILAVGVIDEVSGNYVYLTDSGAGEFVVPTNRTAVAVNFVGSAALSNTQVKFGSASLDATATQSDAVTAEDTGFGFGTGDLTVEGWYYFGALNNGRVLFDMRNTAATDSALSLRESGTNLEVFIGSTSQFVTSGATISTGTWFHVAVTRESGTLRAFIDGTLVGSSAASDDLGTSAPLHLGANYQDTNGCNAYIDEFRIEKGVAKYTASFAAPTAELTADKDTSILLHFNGTPGSTETADDIIVTQDIRFGTGQTADKTTLADYSEFGADLRSIGCAVEYGAKGVVGDGQGTSLRLFAINFNYVGSGGDYSNDPNLAIQANEVEENNNASVYYVSIDQGGDFRVGDAFFVDQATGRVTFSDTTTDLTSLSSLTITDGTNASVITPTSGKFGNVQISGNTIESTTGDLNLVTAGAGDVNVAANLNVTGIITASGINLQSISNGDTSVALDDTGVDGTIRFITDGTEAGRFNNSNNLVVTNDISAQNVSAASTVSAAFFEGDGSKLTNISAGSVDLTGTYQNLAGLNVSGPGIALTVANDVSIGGTVIATTYYGSFEGNVTGDLAGNSTGNHNGDVYSRDGSQLVLEVPASSGVAHYIGTVTGDVTGDLTGDSFGTHTGQQNGDVYTADGATLVVDTANTPSPIFKGDAEGLTGVPNITVGNVGASGSITAGNKFYGDGSELTNISSDNVDLTGTDQSLNTLGITTTIGIGLTVAADAKFNGDILGDGATNISGISSVTASDVYAQNYDSLSDSRLKDNIVVIDDALGKLVGISGVSYTWKNNGKATMGVVAQEVQAVFPELITEGEHLTVNYNGLIGVLIQSVKELNDKVAALEAKLAD